MEKINVGIAEDNFIFRHGLTHLLAHAPDVTVVLEAASGRELIALLGQCCPEVLLLDVTLPGMSGLEATRYLGLHHSGIRVIGFSAHHERAIILAMTEAGACGYVSKNAEPAEILSAVRTVARRGHYFDQTALRVLHERIVDRAAPLPLTEPEKIRAVQSQQLSRISPRERSILQGIAEGKTSPEIADRLFISKDTVRNHKANISQKLALRGRNQLFTFALSVASLLGDPSPGDARLMRR